MRKKIINNIILILIIMGILGVSIIGLFSATKDYTYAVDLENQTNETNNSNVLFDIGFAETGSTDITGHSITANVNPEYSYLCMTIQLTSGSTLTDAKIEFFDSSNGKDLNWDLGFGSISNSAIKSSSNSTKTIYLNSITAKESEHIRCQIKPELSSPVDLNKLNETSKAVFTGTCTDKTGAKASVYKEIYFNIGWTGTFTLDLNQTGKTYRKNSDQTVTIETTVMNQINDSGVDNALPVKETQLIVDVPTYKGVSPTSVTVTPKKTMATNGQDESNIQTSLTTYNWNSSTGKLTITTSNPADSTGKFACGQGMDEYSIIYTYPKAAYDAFTEPATITSKVTGKMTIYTSSTSTIDITSKIDETITFNREIGASEQDLSKKAMYINSLIDGGRYDGSPSYNSRIDLHLEEIVNLGSCKVEYTPLQFVIDGTPTSTYIGGRNYVPITKILISQESFIDALGSSGYVRIYDEKNNLIGTINSSTTLNSNNEYEFEIPESYQQNAENLILITSEPQENVSVLQIVHQRAASKELPFTLKQIQQITESYSIVNAYQSSKTNPTNFKELEDSPRKTDEAFFIESYTEANLNVMTSKLDASNSEFQDLLLHIVLSDTTLSYTDTWQTPIFDIELPEYITDISDVEFIINIASAIQNYSISLNNSAGSVAYVGDKIHILFGCNGIHQWILFDNPIVIGVNVKVKVDQYATNTTQNVNLYYINNAVYKYANSGTWQVTEESTGATSGFGLLPEGTVCGVDTGEVNFVTDTNLLCIAELSNYNGTDTINSIDNKDEVGNMGINGASPVMTLIAQNNHTVPISGVKLLGRIPYTGNTYAISGEDLGTTINTILTSNITQLTDKNNVTIYYSDNLNATEDLDLAENNWTTSPNMLSSIKSYLIVIDDTLAVGEQVKFSYEFYVAPGLNYGENLFANFGAYYNVNSTTQSSETAKIGLTTGTGPIITAEKTSSIAAGNTVKEGDIITYTITVRNTGSVNATNVVITDNIPENTIYLSKDQSGNYTKQPTISQVTENVGTLAVGASYTYSFSVEVGEIVENTTITNTAIITADGMDPVYSTTTTISAVTSAPSITLTKTSSIPEGQVVREGDEITYTIIARNDGDANAINVIIHDVVPKNTTYKDPTTGQTDSTKERVDSEAKAILAPGEEYQFQFTVVVNPIEEDTVIQNAATVTYDNGETVTSNPVEIPAVTSEILLRVEKTSSIAEGAKVKEGDLIRYTITVYNVGNNVAKNVVIKDTIPTGTTYYDTTTNTENTSVTEISETKATLEPGKSFSLSFTVKVGRINTATTIRNTATVTADDLPDIPSNTVEIEADITIPELRIEKESSIAEGKKVKAGDIITYTITVYNDGDTPAYNVVIRDTIPEYTTYAEKSGNQYISDTTKKSVSKTIEILNPGESATLEFSVVVNTLSEVVQIKNTANVKADNGDEISSNTVIIDTEIKDTTQPEELPYTGTYSIIIVLVIAIIILSILAILEYRRIRNI